MINLMILTFIVLTPVVISLLAVYAVSVVIDYKYYDSLLGKIAFLLSLMLILIGLIIAGSVILTY